VEKLQQLTQNEGGQAVKIKTLEQLYQAANAKKAVTVGMIHRKPTPAAWVLSYQGNLLRQLFRDGIYLYKPANRKRKAKESKP
jgi:hypothetical protein